MSTSQSTSGEAKERVLSDFAGVNPPTQIPKDLFANSLVSFIPMADVSESGDWINRQSRILSDVRSGFTSFRENDVLVAKITPCLENGKGAHATDLVNGIGFGSTEFHVLRPMASTNARFLFHVTQSRRLRSVAESYMIGSAGQQRVQAEFFHKYKMPALRPAEQTQTATVLDTLDIAIRRTEAIIEKLKQVKQGLLHDLLTRGIDDNGDLRPPHSEAPHQYKESTLGWIPKVWTIQNLRDIADLQVGFAFKSEWFSDDGETRLLRGENVGFGSPDWGDAKYLPSSRVRPFIEYVLAEGDVVIGMDRTFTKSGVKISVLSCADLPSLLVQRVGRFVPKICSPHFLRHLLRWPSYHAALLSQQKGMDIPHLSRDEILQPMVPMPSLGEQRSISDALHALDKRISSSELDVVKQQELKAGLIEDLLTGRVRVTPLLKE